MILTCLSVVNDVIGRGVFQVSGRIRPTLDSPYRGSSSLSTRWERDGEASVQEAQQGEADRGFVAIAPTLKCTYRQGCVRPLREVAGIQPLQPPSAGHLPGGAYNRF